MIAGAVTVNDLSRCSKHLGEVHLSIEAGSKPTNISTCSSFVAFFQVAKFLFFEIVEKTS